MMNSQNPGYVSFDLKKGCKNAQIPSNEDPHFSHLIVYLCDMNMFIDLKPPLSLSACGGGKGSPDFRAQELEKMPPDGRQLLFPFPFPSPFPASSLS